MNADAQLGRRLALTGMLVSAVLAALNVAVGQWTHSASLLATGVEFAGDVLASGVVWLGMTVGVRPADENHPYGHGRVETLAAFLVGLVLVAGGAGICWNAVHDVAERHAPPSALALLTLLGVIAVRGAMSTMKFRAGRRIGSAALMADAWNDAVDILSAVVALAAVGAAIYGGERYLAADHYGAFAVGLIVVGTGLRVIHSASLDLVDTMPDPRMIELVRGVAMAVPGVAGIDKVHARRTGFRYHVDLHLEVPPEMTVLHSHALAGHVRSRIREQLRWVADVLVHVEPAGETQGTDRTDAHD